MFAKLLRHICLSSICLKNVCLMWKKSNCDILCSCYVNSPTSIVLLLWKINSLLLPVLSSSGHGCQTIKHKFSVLFDCFLRFRFLNFPDLQNMRHFFSSKKNVNVRAFAEIEIYVLGFHTLSKIVIFSISPCFWFLIEINQIFF